MMISSLDLTKSVFGFTLSDFLTVREGFEFTHWINPGAVANFSEQVSSRLERDPKFASDVLNVFSLARKELLSVNQRLLADDLKQLSDNELAGLYREFAKAYRNLYPGFYLGVYATTVEENAQNWLASKLKKQDKGDKFDEYLAELSAPRMNSLAQEEEKSLIQIAIKSKEEKLSAQSINKLISEHVLRYAGLPVLNDETKSWTRAYFAKKLEKLKGLGITELRKLHSDIDNYPHRTSVKQDEILYDLRAPIRIKVIFKFIGQSAWIRLIGRSTFALAHHAARGLFAEIGRRRGLSFEEVKWLAHEEIDNLMRTGELPSKNRIVERKQAAILLYRDGKILIKEGKQAREFAEKEIDVLINGSQSNFLTGKVANPGLVEGVAKLIHNQRDVNKMKSGDILIARMTTVDIMPAAKMAAAIVTDEGGITCHAAIISRELGIPCVIGTHDATKMIRDGDNIKVNAKQGVVTIVNRK